MANAVEKQQPSPEAPLAGAASENSNNNAQMEGDLDQQTVDELMLLNSNKTKKENSRQKHMKRSQSDRRLTSSKNKGNPSLSNLECPGFPKNGYKKGKGDADNDAIVTAKSSEDDMPSLADASQEASVFTLSESSHNSFAKEKLRNSTGTANLSNFMSTNQQPATEEDDDGRSAQEGGVPDALRRWSDTKSVSHVAENKRSKSGGSKQRRGSSSGHKRGDAIPEDELDKSGHSQSSQRSNSRRSRSSGRTADEELANESDHSSSQRRRRGGGAEKGSSKRKEGGRPRKPPGSNSSSGSLTPNGEEKEGEAGSFPERSPGGRRKRPTIPKHYRSQSSRALLQNQHTGESKSGHSRSGAAGDDERKSSRSGHKRADGDLRQRRRSSQGAGPDQLDASAGGAADGGKKRRDGGSSRGQRSKDVKARAAPDEREERRSNRRSSRQTDSYEAAAAASKSGMRKQSPRRSNPRRKSADASDVGDSLADKMIEGGDDAPERRPPHRTRSSELESRPRKSKDGKRSSTKKKSSLYEMDGEEDDAEEWLAPFETQQFPGAKTDRRNKSRGAAAAAGAATKLDIPNGGRGGRRAGLSRANSSATLGASHASRSKKSSGGQTSPRHKGRPLNRQMSWKGPGKEQTKPKESAASKANTTNDLFADAFDFTDWAASSSYFDQAQKFVSSTSSTVREAPGAAATNARIPPSSPNGKSSPRTKNHIRNNKLTRRASADGVNSSSPTGKQQRKRGGVGSPAQTQKRRSSCDASPGAGSSLKASAFTGKPPFNW